MLMASKSQRAAIQAGSRGRETTIPPIDVVEQDTVARKFSVRMNISSAGPLKDEMVPNFKPVDIMKMDCQLSFHL